MLALSYCNAARYTKMNQNQNRGAAANYAQQPQLQAANSAELQKVRSSISRDMLKYMNLSADPCEDFYEYACGNWAQHHLRQLRGAYGSAQTLMEERITEQLQKMLTTPLTALQTREQSNDYALNVRKVRSFYESCVQIEANAAERAAYLRQVLRKHGGLRIVENSNWQTDNHWLQMLAALRRNYGLDILVGFDVQLNLQQLRGNSIYLGEPKLTIIPKEQCNAQAATRDANVRNGEFYTQQQQQVADNMMAWFDIESGEAARFAGDIIRFEFELCKRMGVEEEQQQDEQQTTSRGSRMGQQRLRQQQPTLYPRVTLVELTAKMNRTLDFKLYVESILEYQHLEYVYLTSTRYLLELARLVRANNRYTLSGYILYLALRELDQPPLAAPLYRPRQCVQQLQRLLPQVLGDMYQRQMQRDASQDDMDQIFIDVVKAFDQQLKAPWLSDMDQRAARQKLAQYHTQFPDYQSVDLSNLKFQNQDDYWHKLDTVLAFNARQQLEQLRGNSIAATDAAADTLAAFEVRAALGSQHALLVGWGLLQAPFYNYYYPKALKYALLAQRLAAALILAFDNEGWNRNPQTTSPWSEFTLAGWRNASECQRAAYSNYLSNNPDDFNNATRLREVIAESSALTVAFNAYLAWLELTDHKTMQQLVKETLPELNFTNTQLFFIYFAQTRCWAQPEAAEQQQLPELASAMPLLKHTPERWNVNGPLSNTPELGREFNCALGSAMNSGDKCVVY
ncbi:endothelin-converting enzyme 2 [Drosophila busckii]|uniref:endothelin-converting enzyme 2 n=1 Tax=Drosophila busckii TaxID=30019 RepID=UPI00083F2086|nr:endothelin-converting enzyme 2 [Drosophila busckii]